MYNLCQVILAEITFKDNISPEILISESKSSFDLPWLSLSKYFLTHVDLSGLLKDLMSIILKPPFL